MSEEGTESQGNESPFPLFQVSENEDEDEDESLFVDTRLNQDLRDKKAERRASLGLAITNSSLRSDPRQCDAGQLRKLIRQHIDSLESEVVVSIVEVVFSEVQETQTPGETLKSEEQKRCVGLEVISHLSQCRLSGRVANSCVDAIKEGMEQLPLKFWVEFIKAILEELPSPGNTGRALELFPNLLALCTRHPEIDCTALKTKDMSSAEFHEYVIHKLYSARWADTATVAVINTLRELPMKPENLIAATRNVCKTLKSLSLEQQPPFVFNLFLLSARGPREQILETLVSHFDELDSSFAKEDKPAEERQELLQTLGTVLFHFCFAVKQVSYFFFLICSTQPNARLIVYSLGPSFGHYPHFACKTQKGKPVTFLMDDSPC